MFFFLTLGTLTFFVKVLLRPHLSKKAPPVREEKIIMVVVIFELAGEQKCQDED